MTLCACPACRGRDLATLYHLPAIPVQSVVLVDTAEEALSYPKGELTLTHCRSCGFLFNATFDADLVDYSKMTEESQHFSGTFNRFARELAAEIAARRPLAGKLTLEIGCGKGDFLEELVRQTGTRALGIDPGHVPGREAEALAPVSGEAAIIRDYFSPSLVQETPDLIICRHTLEHIAEVGQFMHYVVETSGGGRDVQVMFETPDALRVLREGAFWDIYHEHCSYFSIGSHARLFRRVGLDVERSYLAFGDQYIIQYATPGVGQPAEDEDDLDEIRAAAERFPAHVSEIRAHWTRRISEARADGQDVALWGGGSKAVAFLTTLGLDDDVTHVIDINAFKQGKFIPGTTRRVSAPEALLDAPPGLVIAMNPVYLSEIRASVAELGLSAEVCAL
ncbi:MAG: class I SAM-dependent methyltransferase [Pseudomonadota bacterium]